jgi:peptidoglycan/LPS O-acetylase OafA/YrhL
MDKRTSLFFEKCWIWVDFFFVLSGFILTHVYGEVFGEGVKRPAYWKYLRARFARVYPLHFFTLLWALAAGMLILAGPEKDPRWANVFRQIFDIRGFPACVFLVQAMHLFATPPMNTPSWSLSTEWWMYLLFPSMMPFLAVSGGRMRRFIWLLGIAGLYIFVRYRLASQFGLPISRWQPSTLNTNNDYAFPRCMAGFMLGMITYRWYQLRAGRRLLQRDVLFWTILLALVLSLHFDVNELITVALFPALILAAAYNGSAPRRLLSTRPAQRLGDWSFSIYMVHMPVFFTYRAIAPLLGLWIPQGFYTVGADYRLGWLSACIFLMVTVTLASLCYKWIEVPGRSYLNGRRQAGSPKEKRVIAGKKVDRQRATGDGRREVSK